MYMSSSLLRVWIIYFPVLEKSCARPQASLFYSPQLSHPRAQGCITQPVHYHPRPHKSDRSWILCQKLTVFRSSMHMLCKVIVQKIKSSMELIVMRFEWQTMVLNFHWRTPNACPLSFLINSWTQAHNFSEKSEWVIQNSCLCNIVDEIGFLQ